MKEVVYRKAFCSDLSTIADVHKKCFPNSLSTKLGKRLVAYYYKEFLDECDPFCIAVYNGEIIGFCMGYLHGTSATDNFIKKNRLSLILKLIWQCLIFNKKAVSKVVLYLKHKVHKDNNDVIKDRIVKNSKGAGLLSICVLDDFKGCGIAQGLVSQFEAFLKENCIDYYTVSVEKSNLRAIAFYKKIDCSILQNNGGGGSFLFLKKLVMNTNENN